MGLKLKFLKCSFPGCNTTVGQHSKKNNKNKQVCGAHRDHRKHEVDQWKMEKGCENRGQYGMPKCSNSITNPCQLDINHIDGNNDNRAETNVEVLCANCHRLVTIRNEHHLQPNKSRGPQFADTGIFTGLLE